ncbi:unnamed protein product [Diplocarpon coronariae]|nr:hypothetical protein JHW43_001448 [Diplocarpon mali]
MPAATRKTQLQIKRLNQKMGSTNAMHDPDKTKTKNPNKQEKTHDPAGMFEANVNIAFNRARGGLILLIPSHVQIQTQCKSGQRARHLPETVTRT